MLGTKYALVHFQDLFAKFFGFGEFALTVKFAHLFAEFCGLIQLCLLLESDF